MEIVLNQRLTSGNPRKFEFVEKEATGRLKKSRGWNDSFGTAF